jgi:hypothetical protein
LSSTARASAVVVVAVAAPATAAGFLRVVAVVAVVAGAAGVHTSLTDSFFCAIASRRNGALYESGGPISKRSCVASACAVGSTARSARRPLAKLLVAFASMRPCFDALRT